MAGTPLADLPPWGRDLLERVRVGHLGVTDDDGRPRVLPVTFAPAGGALWSAVDEKPKRVAAAELARLRWIAARPAVSLTVDRYDDDWSRLAWVQVLGDARVVDDTPAPRELVEKYAPYRERAPAGPLIRIEPVRVLAWRADAR